MNVQHMTRKIIEQGYSQERMAEALKAYGLDTNQSMVSRVLRGSRPSYNVGKAIERMYLDVCNSQEGRK